MVAHEQEHGDAAAGEPHDAPGELPLLRLGGVPALVRVAGEQHQVDVIAQRVVHQLVQSGQEVLQASREARGRVRPPIVLHPYVQVGKVQDTH